MKFLYPKAQPELATAKPKTEKRECIHAPIWMLSTAPW